MTPLDFQHAILDWFDREGRKHLPWQQDITPYRVWLSEIMLQQTQVTTVIPYFNEFTKHFPDIETLAAAPVDDVLPYWSGLGYYARARNLHKAARLIVGHGTFPDTLDHLAKLPGIGQSTAGAILSIAFQKSHPILDGNVRRVLARFKAIDGWTGGTEVNKKLWALSTELTPTGRVADYTQAIMDLGATVCTRSNPACSLCPLNSACLARINNLQASLPTPKPSKTLPVKKRVFLLLENERHEILLEKRPPTGIWGGLWSLPEFDNINAVYGWCAMRNLTVVKQKTLPVQRHTFSHYHLDYTSLIIQADNLINLMMDRELALWYNPISKKRVGMATPIKQLLLNYFQE